MRKTITLLTIVVLTLFAFAIPAQAAPTHKAVFVVGQVSYTVDEQAKQMDAKTFIENSRTYVPVRYLGDALGAETGWNEGTRTVTVTLDSKVVKLVIGSKTLNIDDQGKQMDVAPLIRDGRTYLPARWVAEAFGYTVKWNAQNRTVYVGPPVEIGTSPFPAKLIKLEMEVGSKKAVGARPDGTKVEITLPEAPYKVVQKKEYLPIWPQDFEPSGPYSLIYKKYPMAIDPEVEGGAMYIPFAAVAEAFGVPEQNMVWDEEKLRVHYGKWKEEDTWKDYWPNKDAAMWYTGVRSKLEAPMRMKNSVLMIDATDLDWSLFPTDPVYTPPLIEASDLREACDTGIASGKPTICCSAITNEAIILEAGYPDFRLRVLYWDYKTQAVFKSYDEDVIARQQELEKQLLKLKR